MFKKGDLVKVDKNRTFQYYCDMLGYLTKANKNSLKNFLKEFNIEKFGIIIEPNHNGFNKIVGNRTKKIYYIHSACLIPFNNGPFVYLENL